ncbi:MAG: hypothetical protein AAFX56_01075 [Pseudomonadota bacterium]
MNAKKALKTLHTLGSVGMGGGIIAYMLMLTYGPEPALTEAFVGFREGIYSLTRFVIVPSMLLVLLSGLLAMAIHHPFQNALWVWLKAAGGLLIFEAVLASIDAPARRAAEGLRSALSAGTEPVAALNMINDRWGALWVLLGLVAVNVVLATWRPRFAGKK